MSFPQAPALLPAFQQPDFTHLRSARIALVNIMDNARGTEEHFTRILKAANPSCDITLCRMACAKDDIGRVEPLYFKDEEQHLLSDRYVDWHEVVGQEEFDLVIVTGINRGGLTYAELETKYPLFWNETRELLETIETSTKSGQTGHSLLVCWSAFAAMKIWSGVDKGIYPQKKYGLFDHELLPVPHPLLQGLQDTNIKIPHSRMSYMNAEELVGKIEDDNGLVLMDGPDGPAVWTLHDDRFTCIINHPEYGCTTLQNEYERDSEDNPGFPLPANYDLKSASTQAAFAYLKTTVCPTIYRNLLTLACNRKDAAPEQGMTHEQATELRRFAFGA